MAGQIAGLVKEERSCEDIIITTVKKAEQLKEELSKDGIEASVITEEPFVEVKDSIEFKVYLMIWKKGVLNRKVELRRIV